MCNEMGTTLVRLIFFAYIPIFIYSQDALNLPTLLVDIHPGAHISFLTQVHGAGKAYGALISGEDVFTKLMVTDGTIEGTRLMSPFNVTNRGEPVNPPWFGLDELKEVGVFNDFFWFTIRDFELERYVLWSINPSDDIPRRHPDALIKSVNGIGPRLSEAVVFQSRVYIIVESLTGPSGLYQTDQYLTEYIVFNTSSYFAGISIDPEQPLEAFHLNASILLATDNLMLIAGSVQSNVGLWAFNGTSFYPVHLGATSYRHALHDSQRNKFYFVANVNDSAQMFIFEHSDLPVTSTKLTNYNEDCGVRDCFSYINLLNAKDGIVVFVYDDRIGITTGSVGGTDLWDTYPSVYITKGLYNNRFYFLGSLNSVSAGLLYTDGTVAGTKLITAGLPSVVEELNGVIVFADSSGVWRLDEDGTSTLIRSDVEVTRTWTQIALPNGNKQLYMSHVTFNTIRGTKYYRHFLHVTNGYGVVRYSSDFSREKIPVIFLNYRFLFTGSPSGTGSGLYYMDAAPESYNTPMVVASGCAYTTLNALFTIVVINLF